MKKDAKRALVPEKLEVELAPPGRGPVISPATGGDAILCAVRGTGRTLDFALREARKTGSRLYLLFVREQAFMTEQDARRKWQDDEEASRVFNEAKQKAGDQQPLFAYAVSPSAADTIVDVAATLGASRLILGAPQRNALINLLRGNVIREVSNLLPEEIDLLVYA
jgi:nucleotide-binding universal stress UspA family protein